MLAYSYYCIKLIYQKEKYAMKQLLDLRIRIAKRDIQMRYYLLMLWVRHKLGKTKAMSR